MTYENPVVVVSHMGKVIHHSIASMNFFCGEGGCLPKEKSLKKKVLVAMSGGVDSSVAAYLLKKEGFKVTGVTMCLGVKEVSDAKPTCCGRSAVEDAKRVSRSLNIPHYVMDFSRDLEKHVIDKFVVEYLNGRTPNPCIDCNRTLKFDILLKKALTLGFDYLATGHYAKIVKKGKNHILKKAKDKTKDQSYFLYCIKKNALKSLLFPLGGLIKGEVRKIAKKAKLPVANKPESQDICFIPERNYHRFLTGRVNKPVERGPILSLKGEILGEHKGAAFYTIGQRGGLGVYHTQPLYVLSINTGENKVLVGERKDLNSNGLVAGEVNILAGNMPKNISARVRYNQKEAKCKFSQDGKKIKIIFEKPQEAITPGQSVVFYDKDTVLGGGVIEKNIKGD